MAAFSTNIYGPLKLQSPDPSSSQRMDMVTAGGLMYSLMDAQKIGIYEAEPVGDRTGRQTRKRVKGDLLLCSVDSR